MKNNTKSLEKRDDSRDSFNRTEKAASFIGGLFMAGLISLTAVGAVVGIKDYIEKADKQEKIESGRRQELAKQARDKGVNLSAVGEKVVVPVLNLSDTDKDFASSVTSEGLLDFGIEDVESALMLNLPSDLTKTDASADYALAPIGPGGIPMPVLTGVKPEMAGVNYMLMLPRNQGFLDSHNIEVHVAATEDLGNTTASLVFDGTESSGGSYWLHLDSTENNLSNDPTLIVTVNFEDK